MGYQLPTSTDERRSSEPWTVCRPKMLNSKKAGSMVNVNCSSFLLTSLFFVDIPEYSEWPEEPDRTCQSCCFLMLDGFLLTDLESVNERLPRTAKVTCISSSLSSCRGTQRFAFKTGRTKNTNPTVLKKGALLVRKLKNLKIHKSKCA